MLQSLSVRNFILIDKLDLEFGKGLCILTGETGAGKSILLDAISFCLGNKTYTDINKNLAIPATVTTVFTSFNNIIPYLEEVGVEYSDELIIKRIQTSDNRKKILINDQLVTQKFLNQITAHLFEIYGQNNHTSLLNPSTHIDILDNYGALLSLRKEISEFFKNWKKIEKEIKELETEEENIAKEIDYLSFVIEELLKINLKKGEEENLSNIRRNLLDQEKELNLIQTILSSLETPDLDQALNKAMRIINRSGKETEYFLSISKNLEEAYNYIEEARILLKNQIDNSISGEYQLEDIEKRLFEIRDLARKYRISPDELPDFLAKSEEQLQILQKKISEKEKLNDTLQESKKRYFDVANILSQKRIQTSVSLERTVQEELTPLKMEKAIFKVDIQKLPDLNAGEKGREIIQFIASTNPGSLPAPIEKIASGGELSRFMLALKTALFDKYAVQTLIFDEIDTGIGGAVAASVGERLKKLSKAAQVIVITHQPQVASKADYHILVKKSQLEKQTEVSAKILSFEEKVNEIARMISGKEITPNSLKAAKELLKN